MPKKRISEVELKECSTPNEVKDPDLIEVSSDNESDVVIVEYFANQFKNKYLNRNTIDKNEVASESDSEMSTPSCRKKRKCKTTKPKKCNNDKIFIIDQIIGMKIVNGIRLFNIRWEGFPNSENSWEPEENILSKEIIDEYLNRKTRTRRSDDVFQEIDSNLIIKQRINARKLKRRQTFSNKDIPNKHESIKKRYSMKINVVDDENVEIISSTNFLKGKEKNINPAGRTTDMNLNVKNNQLNDGIVTEKCEIDLTSNDAEIDEKTEDDQSCIIEEIGLSEGTCDATLKEDEVNLALDIEQLVEEIIPDMPGMKDVKEAHVSNIGQNSIFPVKNVDVSNIKKCIKVPVPLSHLPRIRKFSDRIVRNVDVSNIEKCNDLSKINAHVSNVIMCNELLVSNVDISNIEKRNDLPIINGDVSNMEKCSDLLVSNVDISNIEKCCDIPIINTNVSNMEKCNDLLVSNADVTAPIKGQVKEILGSVDPQLLLNEKISVSSELIQQDPCADVPEIFSVEKILDMKFVHGKKIFYLKWEGFSDAFNTWEPEENLQCFELLEEFLQKRKIKRAKQLDSSLSLLNKEPPLLEILTEKDIIVEPMVKQRGFIKGRKPDVIIGSGYVNDELMFLIKWKNVDMAHLVPSKRANIECPQAVIQYYESNLSWMNDNGSVTSRPQTRIMRETIEEKCARIMAKKQLKLKSSEKLQTKSIPSKVSEDSQEVTKGCQDLTLHTINEFKGGLKRNQCPRPQSPCFEELPLCSYDSRDMPHEPTSCTSQLQFPTATLHPPQSVAQLSSQPCLLPPRSSEPSQLGVKRSLITSTKMNIKRSVRQSSILNRPSKPRKDRSILLPDPVPLQSPFQTPLYICSDDYNNNYLTPRSRDTPIGTQQYNSRNLVYIQQNSVQVPGQYNSMAATQQYMGQDPMRTVDPSQATPIQYRYIGPGVLQQPDEVVTLSPLSSGRYCAPSIDSDGPLLDLLTGNTDFMSLDGILPPILEGHHLDTLLNIDNS